MTDQIEPSLQNIIDAKTRQIYELQDLLEEALNNKPRLETLTEVFSIYADTRGVGHTKLLLEGVISQVASYREVVIIIAEEKQRMQFISTGASIISIEQLKNLRGVKKPIIWDNWAIIRLCDAGVKVHASLRNIQYRYNKWKERTGY